MVAIKPFRRTGRVAFLTRRAFAYQARLLFMLRGKQGEPLYEARGDGREVGPRVGSSECEIEDDRFRKALKRLITEHP